MTAALVAAGALGGLLWLVIALAARRGRAEARLRTAEEALHVRERQLEAANRRPRDADELARRLRSGEF